MNLLRHASPIKAGIMNTVNVMLQESNAEKKNKNISELNYELENYFENTIIPHLFVDDNQVLRKFSPPAMKQFKLTPADIGKHMKHVLSNIPYPAIIENINEVIETGKTLKKEIQTTDLRWFQMNILPNIIRKENKTNGVIITFVEITDRILNHQEIEKLNADHKAFISSVSHDIKQPLSILLLLVEPLTEAFENNNPDQFNTGIEMLKKSITRMKVILEELPVLLRSKLPSPELVNA
jgi:two-component system, OmpR family, phosphate regulon sensor histidine kinase PhoR